MALGYKTGGRTQGTPNKRTLEAAEVLEELGCDPIRGMAEIAMNDSHPVELRARMFMELARYVYPKRKAVDLHMVEEPPQDLEPGKKLMEFLEKRRVNYLAGTTPEQENRPDPEHIPGSHAGSQARGFVATSVDGLNRREL